MFDRGSNLRSLCEFRKVVTHQPIRWPLWPNVINGSLRKSWGLHAILLSKLVTVAGAVAEWVDYHSEDVGQNSEKYQNEKKCF